MKYILASQSPRRRELLGRLGIGFTVEPAAGQEIIKGDSPEEIVKNLAACKAEEVAGKHAGEDALIIGADTIVVADGQILGKPRDRAEMERMIMRLQNNTHEVYTGVALCRVEGQEVSCHCFAERTGVSFYPMTREQVAEYAAHSDGMDKAGGYGIQSDAAVFIKGIEGDYHNVVGLPVARLYHELLASGWLK